MSYQSDRQWSDQFIPAIKLIVGPMCILEGTEEQDCVEASDLVILRARGDLRIACRVRRPGYAASRYPWEFTIRSKRKSGMRTELPKIVEGWGDWMFYGHSNADETEIDRWMVVDLSQFRLQWNRDLYSRAMKEKPRLRWGEKENTDGRSSFLWFDARTFTSSILVASSEPLPQGLRVVSS